MTRELVPVTVGDRMRDNDPRSAAGALGKARVLIIQQVFVSKVRAQEEGMDRVRWYDRSRIYPAGTVRRSGFSLLARDGT